MKNIAIIIEQLHGGGAERSAGLLSKYLSRVYNVYIFLKNDTDSYNAYGGMKILISPENGESNVSCLKRLKVKYHIDCAISFMENNNILNFMSKTNEAIIFSYRTTLGRRKIAKVTDYTIRWINQYSDHIVSVSEGCKYDLIKNYELSSDNITTIYNYIDKEMVLQNASESVDPSVLKFKGNSKLVLHVGRLGIEKNQERLLVQFSKLADQEDVKLLIIGSGSEEDRLKDRISELKLADKVKMLPFMNNPFPYFKIANAFILTSRVEGMPNVLLEAMLLKTPIISVDCMSGPRELIAEDKDYEKPIKRYAICKNGILVEDIDTDDTGATTYLCEAMQRALADSSLRERISNNAYRFMEEYSNEVILRQWITVIEETAPGAVNAVDKLIPALRNKSEVIVYGAGSYGAEFMRFLLEERNTWDFICFAVTDKSRCVSPVENIPVFELTELYGHRDKALVVISVRKPYEDEVLQNVKKHRFEYVWGKI